MIPDQRQQAALDMDRSSISDSVWEQIPEQPNIDRTFATPPTSMTPMPSFHGKQPSQNLTPIPTVGNFANSLWEESPLVTRTQSGLPNQSFISPDVTTLLVRFD